MGWIPVVRRRRKSAKSEESDSSGECEVIKDGRSFVWYK